MALIEGTLKANQNIENACSLLNAVSVQQKVKQCF